MHIKVKSLGLATSSVNPGEQHVFVLPSATTLEQLLYLLGEDDNYDDLKSCEIIVNKRMADERTVLKEGDEVIIVRIPVGG